MKFLILLSALIACHSAFAQQQADQLLKSVFESEKKTTSTELGETDLSFVAATTIRSLVGKGYLLAKEVNGTLKKVSLEELEKQNYEASGIFMLISEDAVSFKVSARLYLAQTLEGQPILEDASVYVFITVRKSYPNKTYVEKVDVVYLGSS